MQSHELNSEDSGGLLNELNRATTDLMAIDIKQFGSEEWHKAHQRQQEAFAIWLRYIRRDPIFKNRLPRLVA